MNLSQVKTLVWLATVVVGAGLGWVVWGFLQSQGSEGKGPYGVSVATQQAVLDNVAPLEEQVTTLVKLDDVQQTFINMNWTGKLPEPVVAKPTDTGPKPPPQLKSVAEMLKVLMIQVDADDPAASFAFVEYTDSTNAVMMRAKTGVLHEGDRLPGKASVVQVKSIRAEYVIFAWDEEQRPDEEISPPPLSDAKEIVAVDENGVVQQQQRPRAIPVGVDHGFHPERTQLVGPHHLVLGRVDAQNFERDYPRILSEEVETSRHRDPRTGRYDGIEIKRIAAGSILTTHGAMEGDVIKSINGHPVTSESEAIKFVKTNAKLTTTWEVVVENRGQSRTVVIDTPPQE